MYWCYIFSPKQDKLYYNSWVNSLNILSVNIKYEMWKVEKLKKEFFPIALVGMDPDCFMFAE